MGIGDNNMKKICGIEVKSNVAYMVLLEGTRSSYTIVDIKLKKLELADHMKQESICDFSNAMSEFIKLNEVEFLTMKCGNAKGMYASGAPVFKIETILQLSNVNTTLIKPQTLNSFYKKNDLDLDGLNIKKYQHGAFRAAYYALEN